MARYRVAAARLRTRVVGLAEVGVLVLVEQEVEGKGEVAAGLVVGVIDVVLERLLGRIAAAFGFDFGFRGIGDEGVVVVSVVAGVVSVAEGLVEDIGEAMVERVVSLWKE